MSNHQVSFVEAFFNGREESKVFDVHTVVNKLGGCILVKHGVELERRIPALYDEMCIAFVEKS